MPHGGNSHQRRKTRRWAASRTGTWRVRAEQLFGYVPRSATEVAILEGGQWGRAAYVTDELLRGGGARTYYKMRFNRTSQEVPAGMPVLLDNGHVEMVCVKLSQGQEKEDE